LWDQIKGQFNTPTTPGGDGGLGGGPIPGLNPVLPNELEPPEGINPTPVLPDELEDTGSEGE